MPQFRSKNTEVIALAVQDQVGAQTTLNDTNSSYAILADPDHRVAEAYGVYDLLGDKVAAPAVFVIDQAGQIAWSHIGQNINDRPDNETILANVP